MVTTSSPAVRPQVWCRYVLDLLRRHPLPTCEIPYREMVLAYFLESNPAADEFEQLLARLAAIAPGGIAEAASLLHQAWLRVDNTSPHWQLELPEAMRTLGGLVDSSGARVARLILTPEAAQLQVFHDLGQPGQEPVVRRHLSRLDLRRESASRI